MEIPDRLKELSRRIVALRASGDLLLQNGDFGFASAPSNIALIKYWGKEAGRTQVPVNGSVSFTLGSFRSETRVQVRGRFFPEGEPPPSRPGHLLRLGEGPEAVVPEKMSRWLDALMTGWGDDISLRVESRNSFPTACGLASSASGYAALTGAIADVLQLQRRFSGDDLQYWLAEWARLGSGSATRSAWLSQEPSFVAWERSGTNTQTREWVSARGAAAQLGHCVLLVDGCEKDVPSSEGHGEAETSLLQPIRTAGIPRRLNLLQKALERSDWEVVRDLTEGDAFALHAVMQTGARKLAYFGERTAQLISAFVRWRDGRGTNAFWTLDAGPNVHILFARKEENAVRQFVGEMCGSDASLRVMWDGGGPGLSLGRKSS